MKKFYTIVLNSFLSSFTATIIWFAISIWVYVQTRSVLATALMNAIYMLSVIVTGLIYGPIVDRNKKKNVMWYSDIVTFIIFILAFVFYTATPLEEFTYFESIRLWILIGIVFAGVIISNIRATALSTLTTLMIEEKIRDKANGIVGTANGVSFILSSIFGGFLLALSGMYHVLILGIVLRIFTIAHLYFIAIPHDVVQITSEEKSEHGMQKLEIRKTFKIITSIPGLLALFLFTCFNNMLGGVFMPLLDPYGLSLVSQQAWGVIFGLLSSGFIFGGLFIAKFGLGKNPIKRMFQVNIILWISTIFFAIQPSIILLSIGIFIYISLIPFIEAAEQTIIQKVVPVDHQGRVFGLAHSIELAASPLTTLFVGPIAQFIFIPFMTTGSGVELIGSWFGTGDGRGIGLLFTLTGMIGLVFTVIAMRARAYKLLSHRYEN